MEEILVFLVENSQNRIGPVTFFNVATGAKFKTF